MEISQLKKLKSQLMQLEVVEQDEAAKIITGAGVAVTQNNNGLFVDMCQLPGEVVHQLQSFVAFCNDNMQMLAEERFATPVEPASHLTLANVFTHCDSRSVLEKATEIAPPWMREPRRAERAPPPARAPRKAPPKKAPSSSSKRVESAELAGGLLDEEACVCG